MSPFVLAQYEARVWNSYRYWAPATISTANFEAQMSFLDDAFGRNTGVLTNGCACNQMS